MADNYETSTQASNYLASDKTFYDLVYDFEVFTDSIDIKMASL